MKTLTTRNLRSNKFAFEWAGTGAREAASANLCRQVAPDSVKSLEENHEAAWLTGSLQVQLAILLTLSFVVSQALTAFVIEHAVVTGLGAALFFSPARLLGKSMIVIGSVPMFLVLPFWILLRLKFGN